MDSERTRLATTSFKQKAFRRFSDSFLRALHGRELGFTEADLANLLGVSRETVCRWWSAYTAHGLDALPHERTGRPLGSGRLLSDQQAGHIQGLLDENSPEDLGIPAPLWNRRAVRDLIRKECGVGMAVRTVGKYLKRWGYTAKKPRRHARKQDPEEIRQWLEETYPAIEKRATRGGRGDLLVRRDGGQGRRAPRLRLRPGRAAGDDGGARPAHPHEPDLGWCLALTRSFCYLFHGGSNRPKSWATRSL